MKNRSNNIKLGSVRGIAKVSSLARILGTDEEQLLKISQSVENYWIPGKEFPKSDGTIRKTNDAQKPLKKLHEAINIRLLRPCTYPDYLHGSLPKRSIRTNANMHTNKSIVISEDISNFFPSISSDHIFAIWKRLFHCTDEIAQILTNLTTYQGTLPQGWKPSSFLANLVFFPNEQVLVARLSDLGFQYSRLTDDITISTRRSYSKKQISKAISEIHTFVREYGCRVKRTKQTIQPRSTRQIVNKQVVNGKLPSILRKERKRIRAQVQHLEIAALYGVQVSPTYKKKWRSTCQKVGMLKHAHPSQQKALRCRLRAIKPIG